MAKVYNLLGEMGDYVFSYFTSLEYNVVNTENTYAWIIDTATSNIVNLVWINKINGIIIILEFTILFPNNLINKWPAIIFAVSRTARDPGRIRFLIVSIITINGINMAGVPDGIK